MDSQSVSEKQKHPPPAIKLGHNTLAAHQALPSRTDAMTPCCSDKFKTKAQKSATPISHTPSPSSPLSLPPARPPTRTRPRSQHIASIHIPQATNACRPCASLFVLESRLSPVCSRFRHWLTPSPFSLTLPPSRPARPNNERHNQPYPRNLHQYQRDPRNCTEHHKPAAEKPH
jgi:hypothetical protein